MPNPRTPKCPQASAPCGVPRKCQVQVEAQPPKILVLADGSGLLAAVAALLAAQGFEVILASDAAAAQRHKYQCEVVAVIAGATRGQADGLELLAAVKAGWPGVKTLAVTRLAGPGLPPLAYELELDDYLHWPLTGAELTARLKSLLSPDLVDKIDRHRTSGADPETARALAEIGSLVDRFTASLAVISQSLEDLRQEYREGMAARLSAELHAIAARVQFLSDSLRHCWHFQADEPPAGDHSRSFH